MKPSILVVDDDSEIRTLLRETLDSEYHVVEAENGFEGISETVLGESDIDLIITDLEMPGLNGAEMIDDLPGDIPIIVISGYLHTPKFKRSLERFEPVAVLEKPFVLSELQDAVAHALNR